MMSYKLDKLYFSVYQPIGLSEICFKTYEFALSQRFVFFIPTNFFTHLKQKTPLFVKPLTNPNQKAPVIPTSVFKTLLHRANNKVLDIW